ncbi:MAG TPA: thioredoxin [Algoriphagus sp.]|jgi:thiol-disulfide isomerase/thioredoxin|uniref:Thioredoxin n=1 Tax=Algoriphagus ornithinivorans TaxID=226506 RepID=A0A1I5ES85_9BACT|nr:MULTISPECIES: thioredoxin family protein [Algoriphagus]MAL12353.1 thioredoxin [Algoriphagus sp.]MAN88636.1 thioredoxin [Algoriphagus sp.]QYH40206.1 thioredoxin family protein [Algoriphagus sp. NBT04N3]SFO14372.1 Thioredoxin [Algoriphagus ornithinivorans]HAD51592.1 thioredoxin [Algoriphagus sp.]|tara:strand:- start:2046 stop:2357 length:312 start_codon:yes stop_codon:yes gene_type:complete
MIELTEDTLQELVASNEEVIVQYSAGWCGNCRIMKPKFRRLAGENADKVFVVVDAEKFPQSRKLAQVNNLPTFASFKGGQLVKQIQTNKEDQLKALINEIASN